MKDQNFSVILKDDKYVPSYGKKYLSKHSLYLLFLAGLIFLEVLILIVINVMVSSDSIFIQSINFFIVFSFSSIIIKLVSLIVIEKRIQKRK
ncbi:MAG: hypothetical protein ACFFAS_06930 [Promethearchaeota archaeon]